MRDFDTNQFKRDVKSWVAANPKAELETFTDFCEDQLPQQNYSNYMWLVDQSVSWYKHIVSTRKIHLDPSDDDETIS